MSLLENGRAMDSALSHGHSDITRSSEPGSSVIGSLGIVATERRPCKRHKKVTATHQKRGTRTYWCFLCAIAEIVKGVDIVKIPLPFEGEFLSRSDRFCIYTRHEGKQAAATHTCGFNDLCSVCTEKVVNVGSTASPLPDCASCSIGFAEFRVEGLTLRVCRGCSDAWEAAKYTLVPVPRARDKSKRRGTP
jgi:hypothetical protein